MQEERRAGGAGGLTAMDTGMQVIAGKDAEIEDLKQRLAALENQLTEERDNRKVAFHSP
jgi:BMFP domain-containing protein YqiC